MDSSETTSGSREPAGGPAEVSSWSWRAQHNFSWEGNPRRCRALDDYHARKLARADGLNVRGSVGLLEMFYQRGHLSDLHAVFQQLLTHSVYIDRRLLHQRLRSLGLPPL